MKIEQANKLINKHENEDIPRINSQLEQKVTKPFKNSFSLENLIKKNIFGENNINLIGDSVSWGLNSSIIPIDSYASILRRIIQNEYTTSNYGFVSIDDTVTTDSGTFNQIHKIEKIGAWNYLDFPSVVGGKIIYSSQNNARLNINSGVGAKLIRVFFIKNASSGTFDVEIDGVVVKTITSYSASDDLFAYEDIQIQKEGSFDYSIVNKTGENLIVGLSYIDEKDNVTFNNYGRNSLALSEIPNQTLDVLLNANLLFFVLGINDTWKSNINTFTQKINYCIAKINELKTKTVVIDVMTSFDYENPFRKELRRLALETNSRYIDFTKELGTTNEQELINIGFLSDNVHPTTLGHKMIAEKICREVGFGVTSKEIAINVQKNNKKSICKAYNSTNILLQNNVDTPITFDSNVFDTDSIHSKNKFICRTPGIYQINSSITFDTNQNGFRILTIKKNGKDILSSMQFDGINEWRHTQIYAIDKLEKGDYIELYVMQTSGTELNILSSTYSPQFSIYKID